MDFRFENEIVLESKELLLRPVVSADFGNLLPVATADETLLRFSPKQIYTPRLLTEYIENALALRAGQARYTFSIFSKTAGCYAGSTAFLNIANADDRLEIGATWIDRKFQGTGLNRQCKYLLLRYAFDELSAHRVEFRTDERNMRSRKAIEKLGATYEGLLREHTVMHDGYRRNTLCYSILRAEWDRMKKDFLMR